MSGGQGVLVGVRGTINGKDLTGEMVFLKRVLALVSGRQKIFIHGWSVSRFTDHVKHIFNVLRSPYFINAHAHHPHPLPFSRDPTSQACQSS